MIVPCECGAKLKIDDAKVGAQGVKVRCPRCGSILSVRKSGGEEVTPVPKRAIAPSGEAPLVLVAHDSEVVRNMVRTILVDEGFAVDTAVDGVDILKKATETKPRALVLDVGIPGIYGFEICERLKGDKDTSDIKIVLLSSVYDMRRYKRTPDKLYGADDYIEKHHIPDQLPVKLRRLISVETKAPTPATAAKPRPHELPEMSRPPAREFEPSFLGPDAMTRLEREGAGQSAVAPSFQKAGHAESHDSSTIIPESFSLDASIFQKEECDIPRVDEADPEAVEKARRFARIIVSDIALYNQEVVLEGLKKGTFYELLKNDVDEGRELYEKRVPAAIKSKKDYYQEAFDNFIKAQQKNVR
ncbi:MAG TPA: response regulator [Nitrospirota bacterium]|nr:response regulator [Nitrospirota bacterium]